MRSTDPGQGSGDRPTPWGAPDAEEVRRFPIATPDRRAMALRLGVMMGLLVGMLVLAAGFLIEGRQPSQEVWILAGAASIVVTLVVMRTGSREGEAAPIELRPEGLRLPAVAGASTARDVPWEEVHVAEVVQRDGMDILLLGVHGRPPMAIPEMAFERPGSSRAIVEGVRRAVRDLPGGSRQLESIDRRGHSARLMMFGEAKAARVLVMALVAVFAGQVLSGALSEPLRLLVLGANSASLVKAGDWTRIITANLLHADILHIAFNGYALYILGRLCEPLVGPWRFTAIFLSACLTGAAASALLTTHSVALGASTGVMGLLGTFIFLHWRRRDETPSVISRRAWLIMAFYLLLPEFLIPQIDHAGHAGGLAGGFLATGLLLWGQSVRDMTRGTRVPVKAAAVLLAALFVGVGGWVMGRAAVAPKERATAIAEHLLEDPDASPALQNNAAWHLATLEGATDGDLRRAREVMTAVLDEVGEAGDDVGTAELKDTLATLYYRLGDLEQAVTLQRSILDEAQGPRGARVFAAQLARFEWALYRESGPRLVGGASEPVPTMEIEGVGAGAGGLPALVLRVDRGTLPEGGAVHAVIVKEDRAHGHVRVKLGPGSGGRLRFTPTEEAAAALEDGVRAVVTLVDGAGSELASGEAAWTVHPMDPMVSGLP
ncbi:MAG: rhomboid family intramembrane serine protease [Myxococcota bacterium]